MRKTPFALLVTGVTVGLCAGSAGAAIFKPAKLPDKDFVKKQVEMAGYNYEALTSPSKIFPKTKIQIYTFFNALWLQTWQAMINEYKKMQPKVTVELVQGPGNYQEKLYVMIVAGVQPDVVMSEVGHVPYFLGNGLMLPLDSYIKADKWTKIIGQTFPTIIDRFTMDGHLYGMPTDTAPQACVYYNKTLEAQAGLNPPSDTWTFDELMQYALKLTNPDKKQFGFQTGDWRSIIYSFGGRLVDSYKNPKKFIFNSAEAKAGLAWWESTWLRYKVSPKGGSGADFASGKLGMYTNGIWDSEALSANKKLVWDIAMFPRLDAGHVPVVRTGGTALGLVKNCKHPDVAWDVIKFLTGPIGQVYTSMSGYAQPAIEPMFWTEVFAKNERMLPANKKILAEASKHVVYEPETPVWPDIDAAINAQWSKWTSGRISLDQAISSALPSAQRLMDEGFARRRKARAK